MVANFPHRLALIALTCLSPFVFAESANMYLFNNMRTDDVCNKEQGLAKDNCILSLKIEILVIKVQAQEAIAECWRLNHHSLSDTYPCINKAGTNEMEQVLAIRKKYQNR